MVKSIVTSLIVAFLLSACGGDSKNDGRAPPELGEQRWRVVSATNAQGLRIEALDPKVFSPIHLSFQDKSLFWDVNCNALGGEYSVGGQSLRVTSPYPPTVMGCPTRRHDEAFAALLNSFFGEMTWRVDTSRELNGLILTSVDGSVATLLSDRPGLAPPELVEPTWRLTSATDAQGAPIEALLAVPIQLGFIDTYMNWNDTCNGLSGRFVAEGQSLRIVGPGFPTTAAGCAPVQERASTALRQWFYSEMTWSVEVSNTSRALVLTSLVNGSVATFVPTP